ncbi:MAG: beta-lactamase family protein, partial [Opitutaceae bacterium]|nr:beta-lactamase family protein [Opitutaceae bacterium]
MNLLHAFFLLPIIGFLPLTSTYGQTGQRESTLATINPTKDLTDICVKPLLSGQGALRGLVVGIIHDDQTETWAYGEEGEKNKKANGDTLFPIASISKQFTALLLAQLNVQGKLRYNENAITFKDKPVTYRQLVTHTSGLPLLAKGLSSRSTTEKFNEFLNKHTLARDPGLPFQYSTFGYGVLGMLLTEKGDAK